MWTRSQRICWSWPRCRRWRSGICSGSTTWAPSTAGSLGGAEPTGRVRGEPADGRAGGSGGGGGGGEQRSGGGSGEPSEAGEAADVRSGGVRAASGAGGGGGIESAAHAAQRCSAPRSPKARESPFPVADDTRRRGSRRKAYCRDRPLSPRACRRRGSAGGRRWSSSALLTEISEGAHAAHAVVAQLTGGSLHAQGGDRSLTLRGDGVRFRKRLHA